MGGSSALVWEYWKDQHLGPAQAGGSLKMQIERVVRIK